MQVLKIVKMVLGLLYLMHLLGCFWFFTHLNGGYASSSAAATQQQHSSNAAAAQQQQRSSTAIPPLTTPSLLSQVRDHMADVV